ncbi:MAG: hypothetical protein AcusKO_32550 [Acuticoccus sp.]
MEARQAQTRLIGEFARHPGLVIAVSGGIDSMTLAFVAHRYADGPVRMVHALSPAVPPLASARVDAYAAREGWDLARVEAGEFADPDYLANPVNRCYFCKVNLYDRIAGIADGPVASGANLDDLGDYRPGLLAASERSVVHPFVAAGIDKATIRCLARWHGLDDLAELPAQPCLASRVETGIGIAAPDLLFVDAVEEMLRAHLGATAVVRCRITHDGVVVELGEAAMDAAEELAAAVEARCAGEGRRFAGIRPYRRGAAFLHDVRRKDAVLP